MATYNFPIASDADDGKEVGGTVWNSRSEDPYSSDEYFTIAQNNDPGSNELGALRFTSVDINGETLVSATLSITISGVASVDPVQSIIRIHGDDVDNCAALSVTHMPSVGWTNTTASVDQAGLSATTFNIDVTSIVSEIMARGGWADGNAIGFALRLAGTDTYWAVNVVDYDPDLLSTRANLQIVTSDGGSPATKLAVLSQPGNTVVGQTIAAVQIAAQDDGDETDETFDGDIDIELLTGDGTLAGTLTRAAVDGIATFNDLSINTLNTDAVLRATSDGLTSVDTDEFDITAGTGSGVGGSLIGSALVS